MAGLLAFSPASAQSDESVAQFCVGAAVPLVRLEQHIPIFAGRSIEQSGAEPYWRHSFRGVSVPIPMNSDGWYFAISKTRQKNNVSTLVHEQLDISYGLAPSHVEIAIKGVGDLATKFGLPVTDLDPMALMRTALAINPESLECDPSDVQGTVNGFSALFLKPFVLAFHDKAYLHEDGILGHLTTEKGATWTYLFEDESGAFLEIIIRLNSLDRFIDIGFEIDEETLVDSSSSPPWMPFFFEVAGNPTKERLIRLREFVIDYSLPEETYKRLDEAIAEFE